MSERVDRPSGSFGSYDPISSAKMKSKRSITETLSNYVKKHGHEGGTKRDVITDIRSKQRRQEEIQRARVTDSMVIVPSNRGYIDRSKDFLPMASQVARNAEAAVKSSVPKKPRESIWSNERERAERLEKIKSAGAKVAKFVWGLGNQVPYDRRTGERLVEHPDRAMLGQDLAVIATSHRRTPLLSIHGSGGYGAYQGELGTPSEPLHGSLGEPTGDQFSIGGSNQSTFDWSLGGSSQKSSRRSRRGQQPQQDSIWDIRL